MNVKASLWKKVWQFACREEDIPDPGDHYRYDIAGMSFLVVRTETEAEVLPQRLSPPRAHVEGI